MKNLTYGMFIILFAAALGCQQKPTEAPVSEETKKPGGHVAKYAIAYEEAKKGMKKYSQKMKAIRGMLEDPKRKDPIIEIDSLTAFTIRSMDLFEAIGMPDVDSTQIQYTHVRMYLGLDATNTYRLYLTPVEGANLKAGKGGKDIILSGKYLPSVLRSGQTEAIESDGQYMFDMTSPCPSVCEQN